MSKKKITRLDRKDGLYLADAGIKGRGVYCVSDIRAGEVLETTPAIILNEAATDRVDNTLLSNYTFVTGSVSKRMRAAMRVKKPADASSVVFGLLTFCNHDEHPNAEVIWEEIGGTLYYILRATRRIPKNTEICTTYGRGWFEDRD